MIGSLESYGNILTKWSNTFTLFNSSFFLTSLFPFLFTLYLFLLFQTSIFIFIHPLFMSSFPDLCISIFIHCLFLLFPNLSISIFIHLSFISSFSNLSHFIFPHNSSAQLLSGIFISSALSSPLYEYSLSFHAKAASTSPFLCMSNPRAAFVNKFLLLPCLVSTLYSRLSNAKLS